ncbi:hypothetical protein HWV62_40062 [Athelia sp. TMB]|nr:hypothetical protein HWV62_40062 [Athelia sp. TMB]
MVRDTTKALPWDEPPPRTLSGAYRWPFREFRAHSPPSEDVGSPGDLWLQLGKIVLFVRMMSGWTQWRGFRGSEQHCVRHPFVRRYLASAAGGFNWRTFEYIRVQNRLGQPLCTAEIVASMLSVAQGRRSKRHSVVYRRACKNKLVGEKELGGLISFDAAEDNVRHLRILASPAYLEVGWQE